MLGVHIRMIADEGCGVVKGEVGSCKGAHMRNYMTDALLYVATRPKKEEGEKVFEVKVMSLTTGVLCMNCCARDVPDNN